MPSRRVFRLAALLLSLATGRLAAQAASHAAPEADMDPKLEPGFAVATIKPSDPASTRDGFPTDGHRIACYNETLEAILSVAYGVHARQVVDGPAWVRTEHFDIEGVPDQPGVPNLAQMQSMYKKLLAERFHLVLRREQRALPIYAITVAKGGPLFGAARPGEPLNTGVSGGNGVRRLRFTNMPMAVFALNLDFYEDRPVVDRTGLPGAYDMTLTWTHDMSREADPAAPPSLVTAMREQLGLRLDAVKGPVEVLVVDRVERPTPN